MSNSLESKICVLGSAGCGKTSLLHRYVNGIFSPETTTSTVGANFLAKRVIDSDSGTTVRLQLWDTAGQERFRSITKLYYRGANAVVLTYSIIDADSFKEMRTWLKEMKENMASDVIVHVVGTKADVVAANPSLRQVPFERVIGFVAENLSPVTSPVTGQQSVASNSRHSSGLWGNDVGWDCCHEISSSSGEGIEEVFRVITRKLVEQHNKKIEAEQMHRASMLRNEGSPGGYFDGSYGNGTGSFRVGMGDKRKSWLGFPAPSVSIGEQAAAGGDRPHLTAKRKGCC